MSWVRFSEWAGCVGLSKRAEPLPILHIFYGRMGNKWLLIHSWWHGSLTINIKIEVLGVDGLVNTLGPQGFYGVIKALYMRCIAFS